MYNVMIIDDDVKIRSRLKAMIDWENLPIEFACEAADSDTARDLYLLYRPKIIITDIFIPIISGLDLAEELSKIDPEIRFIVITGYDDFGNAQRAVKLGAVDLLSKPLFPDAINESLRKAVRYFEKLQKDKASFESLQELLKNNLHDIQASYVGSLLHSRPKQPELIAQKLRSLRLSLNGPRYCALLVSAESDASQDGFEAISVLLKDTLLTILNSHGFEAFSYLDSRFRISCVVSFSEDVSEDDIETVLNMVSDEMKLTANCATSAGIGKIVNKLEDLYLSYNEAKLAMNYSMVTPDNQVTLYKNINKLMDPFPTRAEILSFIQNALQTDSEESIEDISRAIHSFIRSLYIETKNSDDAAQQTRSFLLEVLLLISAESYRFGCELEKIAPYEEIRNNLFLSSSQNEQTDFIIELAQKLYELKNHKTAEKTNHLIGIAKSYISENLGNEQLNLDMVSDHVGLSKIYFCRLFHKEEGISFTNYLKQERIRMAKNLLLTTNKKIYEISLDVGFSNAKYFGYVFKQETGLTPGDFQRTADQ
ncbi:MAG: response regulator [Eubacteriales bacterium]|nr:response regulator [Eubacteriales bacterium]